MLVFTELGFWSRCCAGCSSWAVSPILTTLPGPEGLLSLCSRLETEVPEAQTAGETHSQPHE